METTKLYYMDPYLREFSAEVLSCAETDGGFAVVLDATAFYPEGGGQPCDWGTLDGAEVSDVQEQDGVITHLCAAPLAAGRGVVGQIDWARRFDHMQQHSGEHICSGLICQRFSCDNVGFHLGSDAVTIDFNTDLSWDELLKIEAQANRYLAENHPIDLHFYRGAELAAIDYRSKKPLEGAVRIVSFPGADCCACCGTHVAASAQIGVVKFLSCQKFKQGTRIELVCGQRAYRYFSAIYDQARAAAQTLSVKPVQLLDAVTRLENELAESKERIRALEETAFNALAERYAGCGTALVFQGALRGDSVRRLADAVARRCGGLAAVFAGEDGAYAYALIRSDGGDLAALVKEMNAALSGRGGGRGGFAQGSAAASRQEIEAFFHNRSKLC